jgi:hypothetical protein
VTPVTERKNIKVQEEASDRAADCLSDGVAKFSRLFEFHQCRSISSYQRRSWKKFVTVSIAATVPIKATGRSTLRVMNPSPELLY